jgi:hypothetical protein
MTDQSSSASNHAAASVVRHARRAPASDRTAVIDPAWSDAPALVESNRRAFMDEWANRREQARREVIAAAVAYTSELTGVAHSIPHDGPLIVDGHQPELFHPGVWAKNFGIARLAKQCRGVSLHLIVDNDIFARNAIQVPAGSRESPLFAFEPFDHPQPGRPWEEARVADRAVFEAFGESVHRRMKPWEIEPLATTAWPAAQAQLARTDSLVDCLTAARVAIERSWGLNNLELPVSRLSGTPSFHHFAALTMGRASEVASVYNSVVHEYRRVNRVRSKSHPVPDLSIQGEWHEAPFRVWRADDLHRQRPYVRRVGGGYELRDEREVIARWPDSLDAAAETLAALADRGIRLRPRALTLTLFARLWLADLFVHGLGGAKYDEMTDALAERLFGAPPPRFLTVSATVWLPIKTGEPQVIPTAADIGHVRHALRQLQHNPQRFVDLSDPFASALVAEKQALLQGDLPTERAARRQRHLRLREINAELAATLSSRREEFAESLRARERVRDANRIVCNREFSWVLYPEQTLREFYEATFPADACVLADRNGHAEV